MAKKKGAEDEEGAKKSKKKPVMILVVVLGLVGAKMFLLKPAVKTPAQLAFEKKQADEELYNTCAEANHKPKLPPLTADTSATPASTTTTAPKAKGSGEGAVRPIRVQLISSVAAGAAPPIVAGMGPVLELDSVTLNLSDGAYLKLGLSLQLAEGVDVQAAKDEGIGAKALDMALTELSKHTMKDLVPPSKRDMIKDDLGFATCRAYEAKVTTVYFTEFVMQAAA